MSINYLSFYFVYLSKVKDGTTGTAKKVKKTQEPIARPGLVSLDVNQDVGGICILSSIKG